jgi:FkbH-like protein
MHNKSFPQLKKNLKKDFSYFNEKKIAILGDSATQFLNQAIKGLGYDYRLKLDIWEAEYDQISLQVFDPSSDLYSFNPDFIIIFKSSHKLLQKYDSNSLKNQSAFAMNQIEEIKNIYLTLSNHSNSKIILYNYTEINDSIFGNFSNKVEWSFLFQQRKLNYLLMELAINLPNLHICDLSSIQNKTGKDFLFHTSSYVNNSMVLSLDVLPIVAKYTLDIIRSLNGLFNKCIILDLDNTTWGGIIGDDGIEKIQIGSLGIGKAFTEFQSWVKKLKNRGVILAVCSKNKESVAQEPFINHPDMILKMEDISVFVANWENKADNIRHIQNILNISFDSMVFIDDNPFERNIVRENLPEVCVPEMPEDPADYLEYLYSLNLFETTSYSTMDSERTKKYQIESKRVSTKKKYTNENDFLKSLGMISKVKPFNVFNTPRVAQLSQRSNQFNLRTIRYTEEEIHKISLSKKYFSFTFDLTDKFGKHGLISILILKKKEDKALFIDTWIMSCRVLKRGMENFVLNTIIDFAKKNKFKFIIGEYLKTQKNDLVKDLYLNLGFKRNKNNKDWILSVILEHNLKTMVKKG